MNATSTMQHSGSAAALFSVEAEKSVLGAVLLDQRHLTSVVVDEQLQAEHFYSDAHASVFSAMLALQDAGRHIDHLTVCEQLGARGRLDELGGPGAVEELAAWVPVAGHARDYARIVRDTAQMRALQRASYAIQALITERRHAGEALLDEAERIIFALRTDGSRGHARTLEEAVAGELDRLQHAAEGEHGLPGVASGLPDLDRLLGGLQPGRLYVLAGRPAMGKSLLALQIARHVAARGQQRVLFASLEMSDAETAQRHLAAESGVNPERLHLGQIRPTDWPALLDAAARTSTVPIHLLDDGDLSLMRLRAQARQLAVRHDRLAMVVVDYLQLMRSERPSGSRVEDVSEFSRGLKRLARELACPVIAVAQLSRAVESRPDKRPVLSDLRESGQIEADADCVLMLYRDDYYNPDSDRQGQLDIIVRKNRQGRLGTATAHIDARLRFLPGTGRGDA